MTIEEALRILGELGIQVVPLPDGTFHIRGEDGGVHIFTQEEIIAGARDIQQLGSSGVGAAGANQQTASPGTRLSEAPDWWPVNAPWPPMRVIRTGTDPVTGDPIYGDDFDYATYKAYAQQFGGGGAVEESFQGFAKAEAEARAASFGPGYEPVYDGATDRWYVRQIPQSPEAAQGAVIDSEGRQFIRQPDGSLQLLPEQRRGTLDEQIEDYILNGKIDQALYLDFIRDQVEQQRFSILDAFNLAAPVAQNPQHLEELMQGLMTQVGQSIDPSQFQQMLAQNAPKTEEGKFRSVLELPPNEGGGVGGQDRRGGDFPGVDELERTPYGGTFPGVQSPGPGVPGDTGIGMESPRGDSRGGTVLGVQSQGLGVPGASSPGIVSPTRSVLPLAQSRSTRGEASVFKSRPSRESLSIRLPGGHAPTASPLELSLSGRRTEAEESELQRLISTQEFAASRGVGTPRPALSRISELSSKGEFVARPPGVTPTQQAQNPLRAFAGTPFYQVPQDNPLLEIGARRYNQGQQELFKRSGPRRVVFR